MSAGTTDPFTYLPPSLTHGSGLPPTHGEERKANEIPVVDLTRAPKSRVSGLRKLAAAGIVATYSYVANKVSQYCTPEQISGWFSTSTQEVGPVCAFINNHPTAALAITGLGVGYLVFKVLRNNAAPKEPVVEPKKREDVPSGSGGDDDVVVDNDADGKEHKDGDGEVGASPFNVNQQQGAEILTRTDEGTEEF